MLTDSMVGAADTPNTSEDKSKVNWNDFWKSFYFCWVETFLDKGSGEELVPLKHFLHSFTRSIFWELEDMIPLCVPHPLVAPRPSPCVLRPLPLTSSLLHCPSCSLVL